jgi:hypothetical protein
MFFFNLIFIQKSPKGEKEKKIEKNDNLKK